MAEQEAVNFCVVSSILTVPSENRSYGKFGTRPVQEIGGR